MVSRDGLAVVQSEGLLQCKDDRIAVADIFDTFDTPAGPIPVAACQFNCCGLTFCQRLLRVSEDPSGSERL